MYYSICVVVRIVLYIDYLINYVCIRDAKRSYWLLENTDSVTDPSECTWIVFYYNVVNLLTIRYAKIECDNYYAYNDSIML